MNEENFQNWIEPELEARVVAWVSGEASAFEAAELERLIAEKPELAIFKRRIEAVQGLVSAAVRPEGRPLRLAPERRRKLIEILGGKPGAVANTAVLPQAQARQRRRVAQRLLWGLAACLVLALIVAGGSVSSLSMARHAAKKKAALSQDEPSFGGSAESTLLQGQQMPSQTAPGEASRPLANGPTPMAAPAKPSSESVASDQAKSEVAVGSEANRGAQADEDSSQFAATQPEGSDTPAARAKPLEPATQPVFDSAGKIEGFVNYGSPITTPTAPTQTAVAAPTTSVSADGMTTATASQIKAFGSGWGKGSGSGTQSDEKPAGVLGSAGDSRIASTSITANAAGAVVFERAAESPQVVGGRSGEGKKLGDVVIAEVEFRDASVSDAVALLERKAQDLKGDKSIRFEAPPSDAKITMSLKDIPVEEALKYVASASGLKAKQSEDGVALVPMAETTSALATKEYKVPPGFIGATPDSAKLGAEIARKNSREFLESQGVTFPAGASATYLPESGQLIVRNTPENLDLIDAVVSSSIAPPTKKELLDAVASDEVSTARQPFSTFSLHVADVSFRLAQAALAKGEMPDRESIRPEEFYNAFDYGDPAPGAGEEVACRIEQAAHPVLQQRNLVRIALKVAATGRGKGQPLRLTVLLDTSGSMEREDRAASVRRAMEVLSSLLGPNDAVTLIGFARQPRLLADQLPGDQAAKLVDIVVRTPSEGGTNLEEALKLASQLARKQRMPSAQNRVVLLTDGAANLGNANPAQLGAMIEKLRQQGIAFDACGVGAEGLNDDVLEALTRKGDGRYYLLDRPEDADAGFARQLAGAFRPAAQNVKVQVRFNPARVGNYRLIGFERHRLKREDFRNDRVDAAELAAEEAAVALYQVEVLPEGEGELGEVFVRFRDAANGSMVERSWTMAFEPQARAFDQSSPAMQLAGTAALLAEKLRGEAMADLVDLDALAPVVTGLREHYAQQGRVQELIMMFEQMRRMK